MNWPDIIRDILARDYTLQEIADAIGTTKGHIHDLKSQRQKSMIWEAGDALIKLHKKVIRRRARKAS